VWFVRLVIVRRHYLEHVRVVEVFDNEPNLGVGSQLLPGRFNAVMTVGQLVVPVLFAGDYVVPEIRSLDTGAELFNFQFVERVGIELPKWIGPYVAQLDLFACFHAFSFFFLPWPR